MPKKPISSKALMSQKYTAVDREGTPVTGGLFVLSPAHDDAAVYALREYAARTEDRKLAQDILDWVGPNDELELSAYQQKLMDDYVKNEEYHVPIGNKTTTCTLTMNHNGFQVTGVSATIYPEKFNRDMGRHYALVDALERLDEFRAFQTLFENKVMDQLDLEVDLSE